MSSLVISPVRLVLGKITRSGLDTRNSRPPASTFVASDLAIPLSSTDVVRRAPASNLFWMREILTPPLRAAAITAFIAGLGVLLLDPPSFAEVPELLLVVIGAAAFV